MSVLKRRLHKECLSMSESICLYFRIDPAAMVMAMVMAIAMAMADFIREDFKWVRF